MQSLIHNAHASGGLLLSSTSSKLDRRRLDQRSIGTKHKEVGRMVREKYGSGGQMVAIGLWSRCVVLERRLAWGFVLFMNM